MKRALVALLALAACVHADSSRHAPPPAPVDAVANSGYGPRPQEWDAIRVSTRSLPLAPDAPTMSTVGRLRYRGGLELASDDARFGGLSGLYVDGDRLLAVSDQGEWFAARLLLGDDGDLVGLADPRLAFMHGDDGQPLEKKQQADAEDLTRLPDGRFAVSFERIHAVRIYDLARRGPLAPPDRTMPLGGVQHLEDNDSIEAISAFGDKLLIGAEGVRDHGSPFWITTPDAVRPEPAGRVSTEDGFGLVALDRLPDGNFLAMERFFAPLIGPRIYIGELRASDLEATPPKWTISTVADLAPPVALDNFEGLAITRGPDGHVRIYIVSDDNFSNKQRTLLYAFDLQ